jgi:[acyl-carrier-protein] S-malonyltransferase
VSIASHSPLMQPAAVRFAPMLQQAPLAAPQVPVIGNRQALPLHTPAEIVAELEGQLTSPVRWTASMQYIAAQGVSHFIELGPKDVLTGLLKRIVPAAVGLACGTVDGVEQAARVLREQASQS